MKVRCFICLDISRGWGERGEVVVFIYWFDYWKLYEKFKVNGCF